MNSHDWLLTEITSGLQRLLCLSLDRTPAAQVLEGTARAWVESIATARAWNPIRDHCAVREAFATLQRTATRWPAPADFLRALPALAEQPVHVPNDADRELQAARDDLAHFQRLNAIGGDFHIARCLSDRQRAILGLDAGAQA